MSLRARLFAATLAALALTLALTIAIGAVLTRRQVDRSQAANVARLADDLALQRRQNVNYKTEDQLSGSTRILIAAARELRAARAEREPLERRETTYLGKRAALLVPHAPAPRPAPAAARQPHARAWRPFLVDLLLAGLAGVLLRGRRSRSSSPARSSGRSAASPTRRAPSPPTSGTSRCRPKDRPSSPRSRTRSTRWPSSWRPRVRPSATSCSR